MTADYFLILPTLIRLYDVYTLPLRRLRFDI